MIPLTGYLYTTVDPGNFHSTVGLTGGSYRLLILVNTKPQKFYSLRDAL